MTRGSVGYFTIKVLATSKQEAREQVCKTFNNNPSILVCKPYYITRKALKKHHHNKLVYILQAFDSDDVPDRALLGIALALLEQVSLAILEVSPGKK
jgi:hypothetical protein